MGWLLAGLLGLLVIGIAALVLPQVFGPVLAGVAPILLVLAVIGIGGVWWRRSRSRIDPESDEAPDRASTLRGEDERVET